MSDVLATLVNAISEICSIKPGEISPDKNVIEDLGVDSIDFLDVTYEIDKKYAIKVPVEQWMERINVNEASLDDYFKISNLVKNIEDLIREKAPA